MTSTPDALRAQLVRVLDWEEAHAGFDKAADGIPPGQRGSSIAGFTHSPWQLIEHLRLAQRDILDFCLNANYVHSLEWPDDYWPKNPAPPGPDAWDASLASIRADRETLKRLVRDNQIDLFATVPTGKGNHTYLRAILLVVDHNAYHLGQLVAVRQALGVWP
jgi:hypothetical protein